MKQSKDLKLLYLEDDKEIRTNACIMYRYMFHEVFEAPSINEAMEIYTNHKPDIIMVDIHLGNENGLDFIKKIRKNDFNTQCIVVSAYSDKKYLLNATELNLTKYLIKPISVEDAKDAFDIAIKRINSTDIISKDLLQLNKEFYWNFSNRCLYKNNKEISLTKTERKILNTIFSNPNQELTYELLINKVWDESEVSKQETLRTMMMNLRKKIPKQIIQTIYGIGYIYKK